MADIKNTIIKAVSEGRAEIGSNKVIEALLTSSIRHIILSGNCPVREQDSITYYSKLSGTHVEVLAETSMELGSICGKPYPISAVAVK